MTATASTIVFLFTSNVLTKKGVSFYLIDVISLPNSLPFHKLTLSIRNNYPQALCDQRTSTSATNN